MTRHLFFLVLLMSGSVVSSLAADPTAFAGFWATPDSATQTFSLDLTRNDHHLSGYHSAVAQRGNRVDAVLSTDGSPSITGTVAGRVARVRFRSGYGEGGHGEALLTLQPDGTLVWKVIRSVGAYYLPVSVTLHRQPPPEATNTTCSGAPLVRVSFLVVGRALRLPRQPAITWQAERPPYNQKYSSLNRREIDGKLNTGLKVRTCTAEIKAFAKPSCLG